jgi:hypothetical protein
MAQDARLGASGVCVARHHQIRVLLVLIAERAALDLPVPAGARHAHGEVTPVATRGGGAHRARPFVRTRCEHVRTGGDQRGPGIVDVRKSVGRPWFDEHEDTRRRPPGRVHDPGPRCRGEFGKRIGSHDEVGRGPRSRPADVGNLLGERDVAAGQRPRCQTRSDGQQRRTAVHLRDTADAGALRQHRPRGGAWAGTEIEH